MHIPQLVDQNIASPISPNKITRQDNTGGKHFVESESITEKVVLTNGTSTFQSQQLANKSRPNASQAENFANKHTHPTAAIKTDQLDLQRNVSTVHAAGKRNLLTKLTNNKDINHENNNRVSGKIGVQPSHTSTTSESNAFIIRNDGKNIEKMPSQQPIENNSTEPIEGIKRQQTFIRSQAPARGVNSQLIANPKLSADQSTQTPATPTTSMGTQSIHVSSDAPTTESSVGIHKT